MKKLLIPFLKLIFLLVGLLIFGDCSKKSTKTATIPRLIPECSVEPTFLDFTKGNPLFFVIKNTGEVKFSGKLRVINEKPSGWNYFYIKSNKNYTLEPGDSVIIKVSFDAKWHGFSAMEGRIETGQSVCSDIDCFGT